MLDFPVLVGAKGGLARPAEEWDPELSEFRSLEKSHLPPTFSLPNSLSSSSSSSSSSLSPGTSGAFLYNTMLYTFVPSALTLIVSISVGLAGAAAIAAVRGGYVGGDKGTDDLVERIVGDCWKVWGVAAEGGGWGAGAAGRAAGAAGRAAGEAAGESGAVRAGWGGVKGIWKWCWGWVGRGRGGGEGGGEGVA